MGIQKAIAAAVTGVLGVLFQFVELPVENGPEVIAGLTMLITTALVWYVTNKT